MKLHSQRHTRTCSPRSFGKRVDEGGGLGGPGATFARANPYDMGAATSANANESPTVDLYHMHFVVDGQIVAAQAFTADGDRAAKSYLEEHREGRAAKLWHRDRLVRDYPAGPG
jgi:hypothetical protein